jgi:hypothetical protein
MLTEREREKERRRKKKNKGQTSKSPTKSYALTWGCFKRDDVEF